MFLLATTSWRVSIARADIPIFSTDEQDDLEEPDDLDEAIEMEPDDPDPVIADEPVASHALVAEVDAENPLVAAELSADIHDDDDPAFERCVNGTEVVVGRRRCVPFGVWGAALEAPYMFVGIGVHLRHLPSVSSGGRVRKPTARQITTEPPPGETTTPPPADPGDGSKGFSFVERFGVSVTRVLYFGIEAEIGPAPTREAPEGARSLAVGGLGLAGIHGGTRFMMLGAEIAAGGRLVETGFGEDIEGEGVVELRARGDIWVSPWASLGVTVGKSLLERDDWVAGLCIGVHTHAYGGW